MKLFRLERLSLEGSQISNAECFVNCRIREVHLPEYILKAKQAEMKTQAAASAKKADSKAERTKRKSGPAVPFQPAERKQKPGGYKTVAAAFHAGRQQMG